MVKVKGGLVWRNNRSEELRHLDDGFDVPHMITNIAISTITTHILICRVTIDTMHHLNNTTH